MPAIHGSLTDKKFLSFLKQCELHNVEPKEFVSIVVDVAMDDQVYFMNVVSRIKNAKKKSLSGQ